MSGTAYWIVNGCVNNDPFTGTGHDSPEHLMQRGGGVFVATGRNGTVVRWAMFSSNWSSLYYVMRNSADAAGPVQLRVFPQRLVYPDN
jgi:hypothetical protein